MEKLNSGVMGVVYKAEDTRLRRHVASGIPSPNGGHLAILGNVTNSSVWMLEGL